MTDTWAVFEPPDQDQVARYADDLVRRSSLVRRDGWDEYRHVWSCGEVIGTALVLGDDAELQRDRTHHALDFHHHDPSGKEFKLSEHPRRYLDDRIKSELDKCALLCANCHRESHADPSSFRAQDGVIKGHGESKDQVQKHSD